MLVPFRRRRSLLFVPAVRPDRYPKALATGVDSVCLDLEDGVGFGAKDEARRNAKTLCLERTATDAELVLRINDAKEELGQRDLEVVVALHEAGKGPDALMLPKVSGPAEVAEIAATLPGLPLIVQIETVAGVAAAREIAPAARTVSALFFGAVDFSAEVGCAVEWDSLLMARSEVVLAATLARISALDTPFMDVSAVDALGDESRRSHRLGFVGKAAIHPTQVAVIQAAFTPTDAEVAWARRIVAAYEQNQGGVLLVDGRLIERPVIAAAQRTLNSATGG